MLEWSEHFETKIDLVDTQHQGLFVSLNKLADTFVDGNPSEDEVAEALQELTDYAHQHFGDEEAMMAEKNIYPEHIRLHHMEHNSFIYDLGRLQLHINVDEDAVQTAEKLVRFVTSWLVYHILGVDQLMAAQVRAIEQGMDPQQAFQTYKSINRDSVSTKLILEAVLDLWRGTTEHCRMLEDELAMLKSSSQNLSNGERLDDSNAG